MKKNKKMPIRLQLNPDLIFSLQDYTNYQYNKIKDLENIEIWLITTDGEKIGIIDNGKLKPIKVKLIL